MRRIALIAIALALSLTLCAQGTESRKERLQKEIRMLESQIKDNARKNSSALSTLKLTRKKVSSRKQLVAESEKEIRALDDSIYLRQKAINRLQERLDTMSSYYTRLVKNAYKNRDSRVWYMYLLSSGNLGQGFKRYSYLKNLSGQMNTQARKLMATREELSAEKARLETLRSKARELKGQRQAELDNLKKEEAESQKVVNQLKKDKTKYQKQLADKKKQVEALNREVGKIITSAASPAGKKSKPVDVKLSAEFAANKGKLPWPVEGVIVDSFGEHYHPVYTKVKLPFNNGIGISTKPGARVKAVFNGVVKQIIVMPGYNECVLIQHGEYFTFYCKLSGVKVKAGQKVSTGQEIGNVTTSGGETQLHFQLWEGKTPRNPEAWLY